VLLVNELEEIYARHAELTKLNEEPSTRASWSFFNAIESNEAAIFEYDHEHSNFGEHLAHRAQVNRLAVLSGQEKPDFTPELKKIVDDADKVIEALIEFRREISDRRPKRYHGEWHIAKYELAYKDDGTIVINGVLNLKKTQSGSAPRKLMEQALKRPYEVFKPELGQITRNMSSTLTDMGITGTLKELFFPIVSNDGIKFRPTVTSDVAYEEGIDFEELEKQLKKLGAKTQHILDPIFDETPFDKESKALLAQHEETKHFLEDDTERKKS